MSERQLASHAGGLAGEASLPLSSCADPAGGLEGNGDLLGGRCQAIALAPSSGAPAVSW
jgi:hypothetical protein